MSVGTRTSEIDVQTPDDRDLTEWHKPTVDQLARASPVVDTEKDKFEPDDGRGEKKWSGDVDAGYLAEFIAATYLESLEYQVEVVDNDDELSYDLLVEGELKVEVKLRKRWTFWKLPDLLLREWGTPEADIHLIIEAKDKDDPWFKASLWAPRNVVAEKQSPRDDRDDRPQVKRHHLSSVQSLVWFLGLVIDGDSR